MPKVKNANPADFDRIEDFVGRVENIGNSAAIVLIESGRCFLSKIIDGGKIDTPLPISILDIWPKDGLYLYKYEPLDKKDAPTRAVVEVQDDMLQVLDSSDIDTYWLGDSNWFSHGFGLLTKHEAGKSRGAEAPQVGA